jgi:hypothetical protein
MPASVSAGNKGRSAMREARDDFVVVGACPPSPPMEVSQPTSDKPS